VRELRVVLGVPLDDGAADHIDHQLNILAHEPEASGVERKPFAGTLGIDLERLARAGPREALRSTRVLRDCEMRPDVISEKLSGLPVSCEMRSDVISMLSKAIGCMSSVCSQRSSDVVSMLSKVVNYL